MIQHPLFYRVYSIRTGLLLLLSIVLLLSTMENSLAQNQLRVMCWNIAEGDRGIDNVAAEINRQNPDIVLLNEVRHRYFPWGTNQTEELSQKTNMPYHQSAYTVATGVTGYKAVSIISRYPLGQAKIHRVIYNGAETDFATVESSVVLNNVTHRIFSTRFAPRNSDQHTAENIAAIYQMTEILKKIDRSVPVIFGGDFNAKAWTPEMKNFIANSGLINVATKRPDPQAWDSDPIDFIFYRGPYDLSDNKQRFSSNNSSDHPWLVTDFQNIETPHCVNIRAQISQLRHQMDQLRATLEYYDPKDEMDREQIELINAQLRELNNQIGALHGQWVTDCSYPLPQYRTPVGTLDGATATGFVHGWALDPDVPAQSIDVHLYIDGPYGTGTYLGSIPANQPRPDVNQGTGYPGNHGFTFQVPTPYADGHTHTLYAYGIDVTNNGNALLTGVPKSFNIPLNRKITVSVVANGSTTTTETITVTAKDAVTGAILSGAVVTNKGAQGQTGVALTYTNRTRVQVCDYDVKPPCHYEYAPITTTFTVNITGYDAYTFTRTGPGSDLRLGNGAEAGENDVAFAEQVQVYPNPVNSGSFTVQIPDFEEKATLTLQTIEGKTVFTTQTTTASTPVLTSHLPNGTYLLLIQSQGKRVVKRVYVQK